MIITLGQDTTFLQHFQISGDSIQTKVVTIPRGIRLSEGKGVLFPDGTLKSMHSNVYSPTASGQWQLEQETRLAATQDSTILTIKKGDSIITKRYAGKCLVINDGDITTFFLFPFWGFYAPETVGDYLTGNQFVFGDARRYTIRRNAENTILVGSNIMGSLTLQLDKNDRLELIDGIGSSLNFRGIVRRNLNFDSLLTQSLQLQRITGAMPTESPRDTLTFKQDSLLITLEYSRPKARGRKIFGAVVPYNRFWRTGADQATKINLNQPIYFNGQKLEKGSYSVFTLPTSTDWKISFNKVADMWGTDYDPSLNVLTVSMKKDALPTQIEQLTLSINPIKRGGRLNIDWEKTKASVEFHRK
jgi:hypothetical protein